MGIRHTASVYTRTGEFLGQYDFDKSFGELTTIAYIHGVDHPMRQLVQMIESSDIDDDLFRMIDEALERDESSGILFVVTPGEKLAPFIDFVSGEASQRWRELYEFERRPGLRGWLADRLVHKPIRKNYDPDYDPEELGELFRLVRLAIERNALFVLVEY